MFIKKLVKFVFSFWASLASLTCGVLLLLGTAFDSLRDYLHTSASVHLSGIDLIAIMTLLTLSLLLAWIVTLTSILVRLSAAIEQRTIADTKERN